MLLAHTRLRSLTSQLLLLVVFPTLVMLVVIAYEGVSLHEQAMHALVGERDERAVKAAADALTDRFMQRRIVLQIVANQITNGIALERILDQNPELRHVFDGGLVAVDSGGLIVASWPSEIAWTSSLRSAATPWVLDHDTRIPLVVVNAHSANNQIALFGGISIASLNVPSTMGVIQSNPQARLYLIADDGHIIEDSSGTAVGTTWQKSDAGGGLNNANDSNILTVSSHVDGLEWTLLVQESWNQVVNPELKSSLIAPLAVIPAILIAMAVLVFGMFSIVLPLRQLGRSALRVSWGDYESILESVGGVQEIRDLQSVLNHMAQRLQQAQAGMHSYIGAMLQGQEDERKRIARELHDDTLQSLIALDQQRQMAQRVLDRDPAKAAVHLEQLHVTLDLMIKDLRRFLRNLRPSYIEDLGLAPALEMLSEGSEETSQIKVCFSVLGTPRRLPANQELGLYRIAQEAVTNAIRHAEAANIEIKLLIEEGISLTIQDDGRGFMLPERPDIFAQTGHYGLMGMVERAEQMGAQFHIDSHSGNGTLVKISFASK